MQASFPRLRALVVCVVALAGLGVRAADLRPTWECLPDDAAAVIRLPRPAGFLDMLRTRTRFGAVALDAARMRRAWGLALESWGGPASEPGGAEAIEQGLAKYGLSPDDLESAFAAELGVAYVVRRRGGELPPLVMALAWLEPPQDVAERMVAAFQTFVGEQADAEAPPQRVDLEMAGHPVTWVTRPILRADIGDLDIEGELDAARLAELRKELAERLKRAEKIRVGTLHVFLARIGGRVLVGQTVPPAADLRGGRKPGQPDAAADRADGVDPDRAGGAEEAKGIFERFLAAHADSDGNPLVAAVQEAAGRGLLPGGETLVEAALDPRPFLPSASGDPESVRRTAAVGLGDLGPLTWRLAFDAGSLRQGGFVTLPAPRIGPLRILEQECDAAEVPSFVTSEAVSFTQVSLDLAAAYRTLKEFATAEGGEQAANMFMTAELQAQGWLGVELKAMLANLGSRHWLITYPPQVAAALGEARRNRDAPGGPATSAERSAVVWQVADDVPLKSLLPKIAALAQAQIVEEQGFTGVRLPNEASVFVGQGHLVVALGGDSLEKTLAGIRNPPAGAASLRESDVPRRAAELVSPGPARMFSVGDATETGGMLGELRELLAAMVPEDVEEGYRELLGKVQALVPPAEEMRGMFGPWATVLEVNDAGIKLESAWEMPAP